MNYKIINVKDHKEYKEKAASFFASKWGIEESEYLKSIEESFTSTTYPMWYLAVENGTIIGGVGVIENDFHERKDLSPNVCALYVEKNRRNLGIAGALLNYVIKDMKQKGITTLYLITDHTSFYERYNWEYLLDVKCDGGEISRMYIHKE